MAGNVTVEDVFTIFKGRRAGLIKAFTTGMVSLFFDYCFILLRSVFLSMMILFFFFFYFLYKYIAPVYVFYGCIQICLPLYEQEREFFIFISGSWIYYNLKFFWGHCRCWEILRAVQSWWVYVSYFYFLNLGPFFLCLLTLCLMLVVFVFIVLFPSSVFC